MAKGRFYGVGVGPGDPELITLKAVRVLKSCPVIAVPLNSMGKTLALEIARGAVDIPEEKLLPLSFPMDKDISKRAANYRAAADEIEKRLDAGLSTALITLGDVTIYSTAFYVGSIIREDGYDCELISGIPSFVAIAARLGVSLSETEGPLHVVPGHSMDMDEALSLSGTKVIMKSGSRLGEIKEALQRHGLLESAVLASDCGLPTEYLCTDLASAPDKLGYYTTLIVKDKE